eukprot:TRINITY_DN12719_c0_g1_i2.p1 TRINITY_DN12719_c0_g1~~TRINITY_DN12719_c0_g1_i2.p1  ORF type:complete len:914 (-),score=178.14 TRINITY_DN12719_c0_g1_i2:84-2756(-)
MRPAAARLYLQESLAEASGHSSSQGSLTPADAAVQTPLLPRISGEATAAKEKLPIDDLEKCCLAAPPQSGSGVTATPVSEATEDARADYARSVHGGLEQEWQPEQWEMAQADRDGKMLLQPTLCHSLTKIQSEQGDRLLTCRHTSDSDDPTAPWTAVAGAFESSEDYSSLVAERSVRPGDFVNGQVEGDEDDKDTNDIAESEKDQDFNEFNGEEKLEEAQARTTKQESPNRYSAWSMRLFKPKDPVPAVSEEAEEWFSRTLRTEDDEISPQNLAAMAMRNNASVTGYRASTAWAQAAILLVLNAVQRSEKRPSHPGRPHSQESAEHADAPSGDTSPSERQSSASDRWRRPHLSRRMHASVFNHFHTAERNLSIYDFDKLLAWKPLEPCFKCRAEEQEAWTIRDIILKYSTDEICAQYAQLDIPLEIRPGTSAWANGLELVVGLVIVVNTLTIGIGSDVDSEFLAGLEKFFTAIYAIELLSKLAARGLVNYFTGDGRLSNIFDFLVTGMAVCDEVTKVLFAEASLGAEGSVMTLSRMARVARVVRVGRVFRLRFFTELRLMVKCMFTGFKTLAWALVLLMLWVYLTALIMRQTVGEEAIWIEDGYRTRLFGSLSWSCFFVFRLFMGDGALADGTPLAVHLYEHLGYMFAIPYTVVLVAVVFGIFNMVTAIMVEKVLESAKARERLSQPGDRLALAQQVRALMLQISKKKSKYEDGREVGKCQKILRSLMNNFSEMGDFVPDSQRVSDGDGQLDVPLEFSMTREIWGQAIQRPEVQALLDELGIQSTNREELFDTLDHDQSGEISQRELVRGIMKLRNRYIEKADIVSLLLGVHSTGEGLRSLREDLDFIFDGRLRVRELEQLAAKKIQLTKSQAGRSQSLKSQQSTKSAAR